MVGIQVGESTGPESPPSELEQCRQRMTGGERRVVILDAARREFSTCGYHGASTARIARQAGCSEPMLYKHFASKQRLFLEVLRDIDARMGELFDHTLDRPGDPILSWAADLPTLMANPLYQEMVSTRKLAITLTEIPDIHQTLKDGVELVLRRSIRAVRRSQELGTVRPDIDPEWAGWMWLGITLSGCYRQSIEGDGGFAAMLPHALELIRLLMVDPASLDEVMGGSSANPAAQPNT